MRRSIWIRILSLVLVFSLLAPVTASAATPWSSRSSGYVSLFQSFFGWLKDRFESEPEATEAPETEAPATQAPETETPVTEAPETEAPATEPVVTEAPETEAPETEPEVTETPETEETEATEATQAPVVSEPTVNGDETLTVVEDDSTVTNGQLLRASTYVLSNEADTYDADSSTTLKYFPVTLYNYDTDTINNATHMAEVNAGLDDEWEGIYFNGGNPSAEEFTYATNAEPHTDLTWAQVQSGTYYSDENCFAVAAVIPNATYTQTTVTYKALWDNADGENGQTWYETDYYYLSGGTYQKIYIYRHSGSYDGNYLARYGSDYSYIGGNNWMASSDTVTAYEQEIVGYRLTAGSSTLATLSSTDTTQKVGVTLYSATDTTTTNSLAYANWNHWDKTNDSDASANGQKTWTGLVASKLDANKNIVFNKTDAGIFNSDASVKTIYTNVEMPFYYEDGTYIFNAAQYGVYFHEDEDQGSSGTPASNTRLYFDQDDTQTNGTSYADTPDDEKATVWAPFNDATSFSESTMDYHFGMRTTIPFTMTANGRLDASNNDSTPITFSFSGDDDVWVFIDGNLIIDLGGIHNRLDATIDFANNKVTYSESNKLTTETGSYNDSSFALEQTLFGNLISQDRTTFAATDSHELTIFYLERGKGSSNCKITFNLPVKDTVSVQKLVDGQAVVDESGNNLTTKDLSDLTEAQLAVLNNQDFTFTAYKNGAILANATYSLLSANGQVIATPSTDANGQFTLKNGQTAKFVGEFNTSTGDTYQFVESIKDGFIYTTHSATATAAGGSSVSSDVADTYSYYEGRGAYYVTDKDYSGGTLESDTWKVIGGAEAEDSLSFVFKNYMNASLPRPSAIPSDDTVVIDYGLSVVVDLFSNDLYLADTTEITFANTTNDAGAYVANYGTFTYDSTTKKITYQLDKQLTGVEVIEYTLIGHAGDASASGTAKVYIIPATTMYYEEDFTGLVTYTTGSWSTEGAAQTASQEPGVVGTVGDSPYGSDVAYKNDSGDSNGSSKYVSTAGGSSASFSYTFTGTETSFFARTSANTGYMRVVVTDASGATLHTYFRDTKYVDEENTVAKVGDTLYNIPVFTWGSDYGTYTVTVTIAKQTMSYGSAFYLDGIRVVNPLNSADENYIIGTSAYASDGESNMTAITLRNKLLTEAVYDDDGNLTWDDGFVVFTDTNGSITSAEDYQSIGPKEEVYLYGGQSISFYLYNWNPNVYDAFLGMKAPTGSAGVTINTTSVTLNNAADCFYEISDYATVTTDEEGNMTAAFTITAKADTLVSLTNLKVTGTAEFIIVDPSTNEDVNPGDKEGEAEGQDIDYETENVADVNALDEVTEETEAPVEETEEVTEETEAPVEETEEVTEETEEVTEATETESTEATEETEPVVTGIISFNVTNEAETIDGGTETAE